MAQGLIMRQYIQTTEYHLIHCLIFTSHSLRKISLWQRWLYWLPFSYFSSSYFVLIRTQKPQVLHQPGLEGILMWKTNNECSPAKSRCALSVHIYSGEKLGRRLQLECCLILYFKKQARRQGSFFNLAYIT